MAALITAAPVYAQQVTIKIQFLNGKNGKPVKNTVVIVNKLAAPPEGHLDGTVTSRTDHEGIVKVQADLQQVIEALPKHEPRRSCSQGRGYPGDYFANQIVHAGVVEENSCGAKVPTPRAGFLIVFYRHSTLSDIIGDSD